MDRLVVSYRNNINVSKWSYPDRAVEDQELCRPEVFRRLADQPSVSNLKHLALYGVFGWSEFDLNKLNGFRKLVHLEIRFYSGRNDVNLHLPHLKVLAFHYARFLCPLVIDCPQLSVLAYLEEPKQLGDDAYEDDFYDERLNIKEPETIRKLDTNVTFDSESLELAEFTNLECLITCDFEAISKVTLLSLPRLKELHYNSSIGDYFVSHNSVGTLDRLKQTLGEFLDDVKALSEPGFKFTFAGFQLTKAMLDQIDFGMQVEHGEETVSDEYVYLKNYHLIGPDATLDFIDWLIYDLLVSNVTGEFPVCFFKKFAGIQKVQAAVVGDEAHFLWFLKSLRSLRKLNLIRPNLSHEFYDQLPASTPSLTELEICGDHPKVLQLNLDFIGKFSHISFLIGQGVSFEALTSLIRSLGKIVTGLFCFYFEGERFAIRKYSKVCQIRVCNRATIETENLDEIVTFFKERLQSSPKAKKRKLCD